MFPQLHNDACFANKMKTENSLKTQISAVNNLDQSIIWYMCVKVLRAKVLINDRSIHVQFGNQETFLGAHANYHKWRKGLLLPQALKKKKKNVTLSNINIKNCD